MQFSYGTKEEATKNEHTTDHYPGGAGIHGSIVYGEKNIIRSDWNDLHARTGSDRSHRFKHGVFRFFQ